MPAMPGTERFQQLCSIEYLHAYFYKQVLAGKAVALDEPIGDMFNGNAMNNGYDVRTTGPYGALNAWRPGQGRGP